MAGVSLPAVKAAGHGKHDQETTSAKEVYTGKGEGSLIGAAKVYMDKRHSGTLDVENFGPTPPG